MKHLKTFESYSPKSEEVVDEGARKFFTGHDSKDAAKETEGKILKQTDDFEAKSKTDDKLHTWVQKDGKMATSPSFVKSDLVDAAKANNWKGSLKVSKRSSKSGIAYVGYYDGKTPVGNMFGGGGGAMQ